MTELSTWFVRRSRDRIKGGDAQAKETLDVLGFVLVETSKLLAPFMPFLSEHIFKDLTGKISVHLEKWSEVRTGNDKLEADMVALGNFVEMALRIRKENNLKVRQPLAEIQYVGDLDKDLEQI